MELASDIVAEDRPEKRPKSRRALGQLHVCGIGSTGQPLPVAFAPRFQDVDDRPQAAVGVVEHCPYPHSPALGVDLVVNELEVSAIVCAAAGRHFDRNALDLGIALRAKRLEGAGDHVLVGVEAGVDRIDRDKRCQDRSAGARREIGWREHAEQCQRQRRAGDYVDKRAACRQRTAGAPALVIRPASVKTLHASWGDHPSPFTFYVLPTDPKSCGEPVVLTDVKNDLKAGTLTATATVGGLGVQGGGGRMRAFVTGSGSTLGLASSAGSFQATSLSNSGKWSVGGNSGAFSYSMPIAAPPAFNGLGPTVSLNYDSSAVDGITSAVNSQAANVGLGWDLSAGQGFIERRYLPCNDSRIGGGTTDTCWYVQNATISLQLKDAQGELGRANEELRTLRDWKTVSSTRAT